jgi:hypothetical protein
VLRLHEFVAFVQGHPRTRSSLPDWLVSEAPVRFSQSSFSAGSPDFVFAFHDREEIGPRMLARIAKHTGLKPEDL